MPEPTVYTSNRNWPIVRKATSSTEVRDWFSEQVAFANAIDADVNAIAPKNRVFSFTPNADPVVNGTNLLAADAAAKAAGPTADAPVVVYIHPGDYDLGSSHLAADTDHVIYFCPKQAKRTQWGGDPLWTDVDQAGARLYSTATPATGIIYITALNVALFGLHSEYDASALQPGFASTIIQTAYSTTTGPMLVGCSFSEYLGCRVPVAAYLKNCHSEYGLSGTDAGDSGELAGLVDGCSASYGKSFTSGGADNIPLLVKNSSIHYENVGWGGATLDDVTFKNCRIYGTFPWFINDVDSGTNTNNTKFDCCYIDVIGLGGVTSADRLNRFKIHHCDMVIAYPLGIIDGAEIVGSTIHNSAGGSDVIEVGIGHGAIVGNTIRVEAGDSIAIKPAEDLTGQPLGEITGNVISCADVDGITSGVPYAGGNVINREWIQAGGVIEAHAPSHAYDGADTVIAREFDGCVIERQDTTVLESGGVVYMDVELLGGGDLPVQLSGQVLTLDCTTGTGVGGAARVALTAGTDAAPQFNFVYVNDVAGTATLQSSVAAPTGEFAFVAFVSLWSAAKTATDGPASHQRSTDAIYHGDGGRIHHIDVKIRQLGATWSGGVQPTASIDTVASPDTVDLSTTTGLVWQLHPQSFPALQVSVDGCYVSNASGAGTLTNYQKVLDLGQLLEDVAGNDISGRRFNLVVWGAINKETGECKLFVNLPVDSYATSDAAYFDNGGTAVTSVPRELFSVAFLIARIPLRHLTTGGGQFQFINPTGYPEIIDLRGTVVGSSGGGAGGAGGVSTLNSLDDVNITTPTNNQVIAYNPVSAEWENKDIALGAGQTITTSDDGSTTLDDTDRSSAIVAGTGINFSVLLGDATTYDVGFVRRITNASDDYIGVSNGDNSVWERVPPGTTLTATLISNSTASGVWMVDRPIISNPNRGVELVDEMNAGYSSSSWGWFSNVSGSGATVSSTTTSGTIGTVLLATGTTSTGYSNLYAGRALYRGLGPVSTDTFFALQQLATVTDDYKLWVGFSNATVSAPINGIYFLYDRSTGGDFWQIATNNDGAETTTITTVAPTTFSTWQWLRLEISSAGNRVDYWIDKTHVGNISTNLPVNAYGNTIRIQKTAGTTNRLLYLDAVALQAFYTGGRI